MTTSIDHIEYVITHFDADNKVVRVEFKEGGWASIPLVAPLPTNLDELDKIVRQFAAPKEAIQARTEPAPNMSFITDSILTPRVAPRFAIAGDPPPPDLPPSTVEEARARKLAEFAAWRHLRETGGITLGQASIRTDRESQAQLAGAYTSLKNGLVSTINWKAENGQWVTMTLAEIEPVAKAVAQHVQDCFDAEKALGDRVAAANTIAAVMAVVPA